MSVQYSIERAEPAEVHGDLLRLWWDNLPVSRESADAKYQWTYLEPPLRPDGVFVLKATRGDEDAHIVGTAGLCCRGLFASGRALRAGLLGDLAVDRDHRTALPAIRLARQVRQRAVEQYDVTYGYPNHAAEGVFLRCGYHRLGTMSRYAAVLRHAPFVRRVLDVPVLPHIAGAGLDALRTIARAPRTVQARRRYRLQWLDDVDARFDHLWLRARDEYPLIGQRDMRFLRWRFLHHPTERFQIAALTDHHADRAVYAYAVVQHHGGSAYLRDLFGRFEALGPLLDLLLPALRDQRCTSVSIGYLGGPRLIDLLLSRKFEYRHSDRAVIVAAGNGVATEASGLADMVEDPERWYLTDADEDT
jgi:hypothetical protein